LISRFFFLFLLPLSQSHASIASKQLDQARDELKLSKAENEKLRQVYAHEIAQTKQQRADLVQQVDEINTRWRAVHRFSAPEDDALEQWANKVERANQLYEKTLQDTLAHKIDDAAVVADIVNAFQVRLLRDVEAAAAATATE
jgi:predicted  nucleic acid-binding Zn-ribbon protein